MQAQTARRILAEFTDSSGLINRQAPAPGYHRLPSPHDCGMIWLLESTPTNDVTIGLSPGADRLPLAEFRVARREFH
jgi:hypothetical protein